MENFSLWLSEIPEAVGKHREAGAGRLCRVTVPETDKRKKKVNAGMCVCLALGPRSKACHVGSRWELVDSGG